MYDLHLSPRRPGASSLTFVLVLVLLASACATSKHLPDVVFPPPPEKGRIKLVRFIQSEDDLKKGGWRTISKVLVPHDYSNALAQPSSLALSPDEKLLYVALPHRKRVVKVNLESGDFTAMGVGSQSPLIRPIGVAVDAQGTVYVTDKTLNAVFVYAPDGAVLRKFGQGELVEPTGIAVDRKNQLVYVVNDAARQEGRHSVEVYSPAGKHLRTMGGRRSDEAGYFNFPRNAAVAKNGELYVADTLNFRVQVFDSAGALMRFFGQPGSGLPGLFDKVQAVAFDSFENVYAADGMQGVHILSNEARPLMLWGPPVVKAPSGIVIDSRNTIYVSDLLGGVYQFQLVNTTAEDSRPPPKPTATPAPAAKPAAAPAAGTPAATPPKQ